MSLFKKKNPPQTGRQRLMHDRAETPTAFSYHAVRSEQDSNTGRQQQRAALKPAAKKIGNFWLQRFGLGILLIVLLVCLVSVLDLSTNPKVEVVPAPGGASFLQGLPVYQQAAAKLFTASLWNRNKITVNTSQITRQLQAKFPEIAAASVTLPLINHRPVVYIQPAQPALILASSNGSFVLDTTGKALLSANQAVSVSLDQLHLPTVADQSGLHVTLDHQALTSGNVSFIQTVVAELAARHFSISSLTLPPAADELDVRLTDQPYLIKFNLQSGDARQQAGTFLAVQNKLKSENVTPAQYIDVRVDGRAYYQ